MGSTRNGTEESAPIEERVTSEDMERAEAAAKNAIRRRGASKPRGAFARSDWFWTWSKGLDLLEAVSDEPQAELPDGKTLPKDGSSLDLARERLAYEVDDVCEAASWNLSEYRKLFHITVGELAKAIGVSESTLRTKLKNGTLTLKEFLMLCSVCLVDPCVVLGYVDGEDVKFVHSLHNLDKASDHRAVGEVIEILSDKQSSRTIIRKSVSPISAMDLGLEDDDTLEVGDVISDNSADLRWDRVRREMLPDWPLWWDTDFDYTEFNELVEEYLRMTNHGRLVNVTYEMKADAAGKLVERLRDNPDVRNRYEEYQSVRSAIGSLRFDGHEEQAEALEGLASKLLSRIRDALLKDADDSTEHEEGDQ